MAKWQSGDVSVNGLRLHYTRTGGDKPPVPFGNAFLNAGIFCIINAQVLGLSECYVKDIRGSLNLETESFDNLFNVVEDAILLFQ